MKTIILLTGFIALNIALNAQSVLWKNQTESYWFTDYNFDAHLMFYKSIGILERSDGQYWAVMNEEQYNSATLLENVKCFLLSLNHNGQNITNSQLYYITECYDYLSTDSINIVLCGTQEFFVKNIVTNKATMVCYNTPGYSPTWIKEHSAIGSNYTHFPISYDGDTSIYGIVEYTNYNDSLLTVNSNNGTGIDSIPLNTSSAVDLQVSKTTGNIFILSNKNDSIEITELSNSYQNLLNTLYGGSNEDVAQSLCLTSDGGFIFTGYTLSNDGDIQGNHGQNDIWVVKCDSTGNIQWQKCIGGTGNDYGMYITQVNDTNYLVTGHSNSSDGDMSELDSASSVKGCMFKLNAQGNILWKYFYGDQINNVFYNQDNNYIIAAQDNGSVFMAINSMGYCVTQFDDSIHCGEYGSIHGFAYGDYPPFSYQWSTGDTTPSIDSLSTGTYYLTVTDSIGDIVIDSFNIAYYDLTFYGIYKVTNDISINHRKIFMYSFFPQLTDSFSVFTVNNPDTVFIGTYPVGTIEILDTITNPEDPYTYFASCENYCNQAAFSQPVNSFIITATVDTNNLVTINVPYYPLTYPPSGENFKIYRINNSTTTLIGGLYDSYGDTYVDTPLNGLNRYYVEITYPTMISNGDTGIFSNILNIDITAFKTIETNCSVYIYPNPATDNLTISQANSGLQITNVSIYNVMGKQVLPSLQFVPTKIRKGGKADEALNQQIASPPVRNDEIRVSISTLPTGIYFVKVGTNQGTVVWKFVKQ